MFAGFLVCLYAAVVILCAWVCDDSYITFRTVDNFISGRGLTYNAAERVQAYTNPLWMLAMSGAYCFSREVYRTSIVLSVVLSVSAVALFVYALAPSLSAALVGVTALTLSKAFVDYSTSGMENALTHLLLGMFMTVYLRKDRSSRRLVLLSLLAAAATVNRLDALLLVAPALVHAVWRERKLAAVRAMAIGLLPLMLWEAFSVIYYGFPLPNTAYAKLNVATGRAAMIGQGLDYLRHSLALDPLTLCVIAVGVAIPLILPREGTRGRTGPSHGLPLAVGIGLYVAYVVWIGGDFMNGRFLSAPFFMAAVLLARNCAGLRRASCLVVVLLVALAGLGPPCSPALSGPRYGVGRTSWQEGKVVDERGLYYRWTGLLAARPDKSMPSHPWVEEGLRERHRADEHEGLVAYREAIGLFGFYAGPHVYILDPFALADPFLARLGYPAGPGWAPGHFPRDRPDGYIETLRTGRNLITNKRLAFYYDKLCAITRGRVFDAERLLEICKMNLGRYDHLIEQN